MIEHDSEGGLTVMDTQTAPSVVLVDDHPLWRETVRKVLTRRGAGTVVGEASDGEEALALVTTERPDVVIMDVDMPGMDGIEATRRLREALPDARVVVMSASDRRAHVIAAVEAGASGYVLKTAGASEVADAVRRTHAGELVFPPALADVLLEEFRRRGAAGSPAASSARAGRATATRVPTPPAPFRPAAAPPDPSFVLEGDYWSVTYEGQTIRVKDLKGVRDIVALLSLPGREVHVLDLVAAREGHPLPGNGASAGELVADGLTSRGDGDLGPLLDAEARRAYKERVDLLRDEIIEAETFRDPERAARAKAELDLIVEQLKAATGLGGRERVVGSAAEKARINVTRSVSRAMERLARGHPSLGEHLDRHISTGTFCGYRPHEDPGWTIRRSPPGGSS